MVLVGVANIQSATTTPEAIVWMVCTRPEHLKSGVHAGAE